MLTNRLALSQPIIFKSLIHKAATTTLIDKNNFSNSKMKFLAVKEPENEKLNSWLLHSKHLNSAQCFFIDLAVQENKLHFDKNSYKQKIARKLTFPFKNYVKIPPACVRKNKAQL